MPANIPDRYHFPIYPALVVAAEKRLQKEAPGLYRRIAHFKNSKSWSQYESVKTQLKLSGLNYGDWIQTVAHFLNV